VTEHVVVPFFADRDANLPEARLDVAHSGRQERTRSPVQALDLTGKPKAIMAIGLGATGRRRCCDGYASVL
jgi:hypothetical protein